MSIIQMMTIGGGTVAPASVCYAIVAGGGGGQNVSSGNPGGGGGGEVRSGSFSPTTGTTYTITVGAGGSGNTNGSSSSSFCISSCGGGSCGHSGKYLRTGSGGTRGTDTSITTCFGSYVGFVCASGGGASNCLNGGNASGSVSSYLCGSAVGGTGASGSVNFSGQWGAGGGGHGFVYYNPAGTCCYLPIGCGGTRGIGGSTGGGSGADWTHSATSGTANSGSGGGSVAGGTAASGGSGVIFIKYSNVYPQATTTTGSPTYTCCGGYRTYKFTGSGSIKW